MSYQEIINSTNFSTIGQILTQANENTQGMFWTGIYWMILFVLLIIFSQSAGVEVGLLFSFFIGLILGIFLIYAGLVNVTFIISTEALLLFIIIYLLYSSNKNQ